MYIIISLIAAIVFSFALSSAFNFIAVFAITFFAALCILTFIDTMIERENLALIAGWRMISSGEMWEATWWLGLLPITLFVVVGLVGGIITAPIWYFLANTNSATSKKVVLISMISIISILYIIGVILLVSPITAYKIMHYGWFIGVFVAISIIGLVVTIVMKSTRVITGRSTALLCVLSIGLIPLMVLGLVFSLNATYRITTAEDMIAFGNALSGYNTLFVLENDIDFTGKDCNWYGGQKDFKGVFDGQGYTLSNITYEGNCKSFRTEEVSGLGFVRENSGIIRNLNFKSCKFTLRSTATKGMYFGIIAAENSWRGKIFDCNIIDCQAKYIAASSANASLTVGSLDENTSEYYNNVNVVYETEMDNTFYESEYEYISWKKVE